MSVQVKSKKRVAEHGEVFTAEREVKAMCDLVADECLRIDSRFLEPACGKVIDNLAANYVNIKEGVNSIMGGKVLNYPGKSIYLEGEQVGYKT